MESNLDKAIRQALDHAEDKNNKGLLISCNNPNYEDIFENGIEGIEGDPETVYSIVSLFSDDENADGTWATEIEKALDIKYPDFF